MEHTPKQLSKLGMSISLKKKKNYNVCLMKLCFQCLFFLFSKNIDNTASKQNQTTKDKKKLIFTFTKLALM